MNYLLHLLFFAGLPFATFGQLSSVQSTFSLENYNVLIDSVPVSQSMLSVHLVADDPSDIGFLSVNVYAEELPLIEEIQLTPSQLLEMQSSELIIPLVVYSAQANYRVAISVQNSAGEYLPTFTSNYPNN